MTRRDIRIHAQVAFIAVFVIAVGATGVLILDALIRWAL